MAFVWTPVGWFDQNDPRLSTTGSQPYAFNPTQAQQEGIGQEADAFSRSGLGAASSGIIPQAVLDQMAQRNQQAMDTSGRTAALADPAYGQVDQGTIDAYWNDANARAAKTSADAYRSQFADSGNPAAGVGAQVEMNSRRAGELETQRLKSNMDNAAQGVSNRANLFANSSNAQYNYLTSTDPSQSSRMSAATSRYGALVNGIGKTGVPSLSTAAGVQQPQRSSGGGGVVSNGLNGISAAPPLPGSQYTAGLSSPQTQQSATPDFWQTPGYPSGPNEGTPSLDSYLKTLSQPTDGRTPDTYNW